MVPRAIFAVFDDNLERQRRRFKSASITLNHVRRSALLGTRKRAAIYQRAVYLHVDPSGVMPKGGGRPFHLFHLPDGRTDDSGRIRKRHLIRRRGHFTFCPPVCPSVCPSIRISFPSSSLFAPPTDQSRHVRTLPPHIDHATCVEIARRDFFFLDILYPWPALQLELTDEWYLREKRWTDGKIAHARMGMIRHDRVVCEEGR